MTCVQLLLSIYDYRYGLYDGCTILFQAILIFVRFGGRLLQVLLEMFGGILDVLGKVFGRFLEKYKNDKHLREIQNKLRKTLRFIISQKILQPDSGAISFGFCGIF